MPWILLTRDYPDSKIHWANMGPIWGRQDPGGPHVGPVKCVIWVVMHCIDAPLFVSFNSRFNKQSSCRRFETSERSREDIVIVFWEYHVQIHI